jgi:autotransporter translocation and assembly factor TamB
VDLQTVQGGIEVLTDRVQVDDLRLHIGNTQLTAAGVLPWTPQETNFDVRLQPLDVGEVGSLAQIAVLRGRVNVSLKAAGPPEALALRGQIGAQEGRVTLAEEINRVATPVRYRGTLDVAELDLTSVLERAALQSDLDLHARLEGAGLTLSEWRGKVLVEVEPSHLGNIALHRSQIELVGRQQRFEVRRFDLDTSVAHMTAGGALDLAGRSDLQYELTADLADLQPVLDLETLAGQIHLQGKASGDWPALGAHGILEVSRLRYQDNWVRTLQLSYDGSQLGAQPLVTAQLVARQLHTGALPVERVGLDATYQGAAGEVHFAAEVLQSAQAGGHASGTVSLTDVGQQIIVEELVARLPDRTWHAVAPLRIVRGPQAVRFEQVRLVHASESVEVTGAIAGEHFQDLRLHASLDLTYLQHLFELPDIV